MIRYAVVRILAAIPTLLGVTVVVFALTHIVPGDPAISLVGENASPEQIARAREYLNLDRPMHEQYLTYLGDLLRGDLGIGISGRPVIDEFLARFPATIELTIAATAFAVIVGVPLGRLAAKYSGRMGDVGITLITLVGLCVPTFVLGLALQYVLAVEVGAFPATGRLDPRSAVPSVTSFAFVDAVLVMDWNAFLDAARHLVLPALTLGLLPMAYISRLTRAAILEARNDDYVRTARAKGMTESRIVRNHVMPNAWLPIITMVGLQFGHLLAGAVITETVFAWNGVGAWVVRSIQSHDFVVVQSAVLLFAATFLLLNLVVDLIYGFVDPRVRYD